MELKRAGSQASQRGPSEWFTGTVRIDPLNTAPEPARVSCASVTFEPGARTAWHTHPLGQTLIVTAGCGWTQCEEVKPYDIRTTVISPGAVDTELTDSITEPDIAENTKKFYAQTAIGADSGVLDH
jgi:quercetin dioxygenase-like cupin family protein